jgi:hypothetical protein
MSSVSDVSGNARLIFGLAYDRTRNLGYNMSQPLFLLNPNPFCGWLIPAETRL